MGANPYCYFTPYQEDIARALAALQEQEFRAGRYDPALQAASPPTYTFEQRFPPGKGFPSPGAQHDSIQGAVEEALDDGDGTGSILDMVMGLSPTPQALCASPSTTQSLQNLFGHVSPTHEEVVRLLLNAPGSTAASDFWDEIGRGECRYFPIFHDGVPTEIFFAGMSLD